jgi:hypothetical protein
MGMIQLKEHKLALVSLVLGIGGLVLGTLAAYAQRVTDGIEIKTLSSTYASVLRIVSWNATSEPAMSAPGLLSFSEQKAIYVTQFVSLVLASLAIVLGLLARRKGYNSFLIANAVISSVFSFIVYQTFVGLVALTAVLAALFFAREKRRVERRL